jgi:hypothetical protein
MQRGDVIRNVQSDFLGVFAECLYEKCIQKLGAVVRVQGREWSVSLVNCED